MNTRTGIVFMLSFCASCAVADFTRSVVTWHFPLRSCHEGIPFGNAESGFLVYGESNMLKVVVGRDDTWDHRGGYDWNDDQSYANIAAALKADDKDRLKTLFRRGEREPGEPMNPQIIPVGRYEFALGEGVVLRRGELDTATGVAKVWLSAPDSVARQEVTIALDRVSGVLALRWPVGMTPTCAVLPAWREKMYSTEGEDPLELAPPIRFETEGGKGFVQSLPVDPAIGSGSVTKDGASYLVAVRGADFTSAKDAVARTLAEYAGRGFGAMEASSLNYWTNWWRETPEIDVPDEIVREIHDLGMYKFGSMAGSDGVPAPLQGPWIEDYRLPPWHGDYHFNINVQLCYWPAFRGNHLEALRPLFRMIRGWWPVMRANARKFAGIEDGFLLPFSCDDRGKLIGGYWAGTMDFACTPWVCQMMMRYVRMSGDVEFLRTDAYPLMVGSMKTLRALMRDDGKALSYPASTSPEFDWRGGWGVDSSFQLAATHRLAEDLTEAAQMLGETPDPTWADVKARLPRASFKDGKAGGEIELWKGLTLPESHRHHSHLAGYVPFDVLDLSDEGIRASTTATATSFARHGLGLWSGWSFGWASMIQTHWGNADAAEMLIRYWERMYTNTGHGSRHDVQFPGLCVMRRGTNAEAWGVVGDAEGEEIMQIDGAMACTAAIHEMMVCDIRGVTHVFRGAPARWRDCSFRNVLSDAGILVSAARKDGEVLWVELHSKRGGNMTLHSPWRKDVDIAVVLRPGETRLLTHDGRVPSASEDCLDGIARAVATLESRIPYLTQTAEETVRRMVRNPYASIEVPRKHQWAFSEEFWERAGGLRQIADGAYDTPDNVVLLSSRAGDVPIADGKLTIRFAPVSDDTRINLIANIVSGWMWCCEYYAAASRLLGRVPPTSKGLSFNDSWVISCSAFSPDNLPRFVPCPEKISAGKLGRLYLENVRTMFERMRGPATCDAVRKAARFICAELSAGKTVGVAGLGHPIIEECVTGLKSNMKGIVAVGNIPQVYSEALKPGDTLVWFAYSGLNTYWADYGTAIRKAGLNLVLSHAGEVSCSSEAHVKAFLPQLWTLPDSSVPVPVRPFKIAPLSEVSRCTLLRMLDAEVSVTHPRSATPPPDYGTGFFATVDYAKKIVPPQEKHRVWTNKGLTFEMDESFHWALKDRTGFDYDMLRPLSTKLIAYQKGLKYGLMASDGRVLTPPDKDLIAPYGMYGMAEREYAIFSEGGKYGKMDPVTGTPLPEPMTEEYPQ